MQHMLCRQNITYYSKQENFLSQVNFTVLDGIGLGCGHQISSRGGRQVVLLGDGGRKRKWFVQSIVNVGLENKLGRLKEQEN